MATQQKSSKTPATKTKALAGGKLGQIIRLLQRAKGASIDDLTDATGWQAHSVRGAISGRLRKRHSLAVSATRDASRGLVYRLPKAGGTR
ncbi:DUF3489 domain-containing protein [Parvibaculum sp.]|jgi:hypothetical protein|uniref:DUF3489 domain-containing protein n=1 Tax=Parvibaculum sp. TaxID=2024848 RepID=UPI000C602210|nr:DUF3489 domain-containing protein [Parvibaculum sp.]MAM94429.1 hypothetical protein [Parvibaculum sp.]HCX68113.1 hypothetical protein [Rhodobiaceae bacterium]|tara:strand:+ start:17417 stop:17686 length:270 start_codon:yes stop_codon:yes gene_type:complete